MSVSKSKPSIPPTESAKPDADPTLSHEHAEQVENASAQHTGSGGAAGSPAGKGQGSLAGAYPNQGHKNGLPRRSGNRQK